MVRKPIFVVIALTSLIVKLENNMTDKEKIRAKIDRLLNKEWRLTDSTEGKYRHEAYKELLEFIDSLPEEKISDDLEKVCEQLAENARKHKAETSSPFFSQTDYKQGVIDGAKWQKEQMMKDVVESVFIQDYGYAKPVLLGDLRKTLNIESRDKVKLIVIKEAEK